MVRTSAILAALSILSLASACQYPSYTEGQVASLYSFYREPGSKLGPGPRAKPEQKQKPGPVQDLPPGEWEDHPADGESKQARQDAGIPSQVPPFAPPSSTSPVQVGEPCAPSGPGQTGSLCLGLKYVVYESPGGDPVDTDRDVAGTVRAANQLWSDCGIQFQVDRYLAIAPDQQRLRFRTADHSELNDIRRKFMDDSTLLVVTTGSWDRRGTLGGTWANAWTNLPGEGLYGAILESSVSRNANVLAHELGHYLSLDHVADSSSLMNPVIYPSSVRLSRDQCRSARWAAGYFWRKMTHAQNESATQPAPERVEP